MCPSPPPPQKRPCFENDKSKFGRITTSIIASEKQIFLDEAALP